MSVNNFKLYKFPSKIHFSEFFLSLIATAVPDKSYMYSTYHESCVLNSMTETSNTIKIHKTQHICVLWHRVDKNILIEIGISIYSSICVLPVNIWQNIVHIIPTTLFHYPMNMRKSIC